MDIDSLKKLLEKSNKELSYDEMLLAYANTMKKSTEPKDVWENH